MALFTTVRIGHFEMVAFHLITDRRQVNGLVIKALLLQQL